VLPPLRGSAVHLYLVYLWTISKAKLIYREVEQMMLQLF